MLPEFSDKEKKQAEQTIYRHIIKDYNSRGDLGSTYGLDMPKDLKNAILYESAYEECTWGESDWTDLSGNGCSFSSCDFYSSNIHNAALQHTLFDSAVFHRCDMRSSNFAYSLFTWSVIDHSVIEGCAFTGAVWNHVTLQDCEIAHSNFELCKFENSTFRNIDFRNLALKYTFFHNVHMENVALPFMQMPYTFGGMKYVFTTEDSITIASMSEEAPHMSVAEYREILPQMIVFFTGHNDYFPLANCYLANGQRDLAEEANELGIVNSAASHDFRKLYFFCVQASQELEMSREKRYQLYERIHQSVTSDRLKRAEYYEFRHYFPMIKQLMFDNPYSRPTLALSLHTNIAADDFHKLGLLMRTLDEIAENCGVKLDSKHLEIRHNSPNILGWFPTGDIGELLQLLHNTWEVIYPILPDLLQNAANLTTLITGAVSLHRVMGEKGSGQENKEPASTKCKTPQKTAVSNKEMTADQTEVLRLRAALLKQELAWQKSGRRDADIPTFDSAAIQTRFSARAEELKSAGIRINSLEIQLLDDHCDALELLYNSGEESM